MVKLKQKAVFLDRDGTICEDPGYLSQASELRIFPFAAEAIRLLNDNGFLVVIITNQSGVGRGYFGEDSVMEIHNLIEAELARDGAVISGFYHCPHAPNVDCECRKPKLGMVTKAVEDLNIDLRSSWVVGDKSSDVETGHNAGTRTVLVLSGQGEREQGKLDVEPDLIAKDLLEAAKTIVSARNLA